MNASFGSHVTRPTSPRPSLSLQRRVAHPARLVGHALSLLLLLVFGAVGSVLHAQADFAGAVSTFAPAPTSTHSEGGAFDAAGNYYEADAGAGTVWEVPFTNPSYGAAVELVPGGTFQHPLNVAVDPSGNVWVADLYGSPSTNPGQVYEIANTGGTLATTATAIGTGWQAPAGIFADAAGHIWVTDNTADTLSEITGANPTWTVAFAVNTALGTSPPYGLTIDPSSSRMYIAEGSHIEYIDPPYTAAPTQIGPAFGLPLNVSIDAYKNLWVAEFDSNLVAELIAPAYTSVKIWGTGLDGPVQALPDNYGNIIVPNYNGVAVDQIATGGVDLGSTAAAAGSTSPVTVAFDFTGTSTTIGTPVVVSPVTGEFIDTGTGTCTTTNGAANPYVSGTSCTVVVELAPTLTGMRSGAVELQDTTGNTIATAYLYGFGTGPQMTFDAIGAPPTAFSTTFDAPSGLAADGAGNVYVANTDANKVIEEPAGTSIGSSLLSPQGVAVDALGNVFIADTGNHAIEEVSPGASPIQSTLAPSFTFSSPNAIALDQNGNIFVADGGSNNAIEEISAVSGYNTVRTLTTTSTAPLGVAVDYYGNVYYVTTGATSVTRLQNVNGVIPASPASTSIGTFNSATAVAVDGNNNLYVLDGGTGTISEFSYMDPSPYISTTVSEEIITGLTNAAGIAVDGKGNVYYSNDGTDNKAYKIDLADAPTLTFLSSTVNVTSSDSPKSVIIANLGGGNNSTLSVTGGGSVVSTTTAGATGSFAGTGTCTTTTTLAFGANCNLSISFTPTATGAIAGTAITTDNNLNGTAVSQTITLNGTGTAATATVVGQNATASYSTTAQNVTLTATVTAPGVAEINEGTIAFTVLGTTGGTVTSSTVVNGTASVTYPIPAGQTGGTYTIQAAYTDVGGSFTSSTDSTHTLTINPINQSTLTVHVTSPAAYNSTQTLTTTGGNGTGAVTFSAAGSTACSVTGSTLTITSGTGTCSVTATKAADSDYNAITSAAATVTVQMINQLPLSVNVSSPASYNSTQTLTTTGGNGTGAVTYSAAGSTACSVTGATLTITSGTGTCSVTATKAADANYNAVTSAAATVTVQKATQATLAVVATSPAVYRSTQTLSTTGGSGTGAVTFSAGASTACSVTGTTLTITAGTGTCVVTATKAADNNYSAVTSTPATITVSTGTLTLSANSATRVYGAANPAFTGTITGQQNGDTFTESFATTATTASNVGTYPIVPSAAGTDLADYTVVTANGTLTITKANSTTSLTANGSSANPGATVTLTATVASATTGTPTGSVGFYDGTTLLATSALSGGVATYSTTTLAAGASHTLTAVYSGDTNFNGSSTASSVDITVGVLDFTLGTPNPASQSGSAGTAFTYSFGISPTYSNYAGTVSFAATGLPAGALATFSPSSIPATGGPQTVTMIVSTAGGSAALVRPSTAGRGLVPVALAFLLLPLAGTKRMRREGRRFGRMACLLLLVLGGLGATAALTGCGSHAGMSNNAQSYTITVTATSGSIQHTATVNLDLQQ